MMLSHGELTGAWYIVTDYDETGVGTFVAKTRHELNATQSASLNKAFGYDQAEVAKGLGEES